MFPIAAVLVSLAAGSLATNDPGAAPASASAQSSASAGEKSSAIGIAAGPAAGALGVPAAADGERHGFPIGSMIPLLGFGLCGAAALVFARKKNQATTKLLEIVETHSLGGRRSLIVARIAGETLLLGSSEGGLSLLLARPGETVAQAQPTAPKAPAQIPPAKSASTSAPGAKTSRPDGAFKSSLKTSWLGKLRLANAAAQDQFAEPSFESLLDQDPQSRAQSRLDDDLDTDVEPAILRQPIDPLAESAEDQELRRKLASGRSGRVG